MGKGTFFTGQPVFNQILSLIPRFKVAQLAQKHNADRYCKKFRAYDHLVTMLYSTYHQCNSLREVITGMQASGSRLKHFGICSTPRRSTLADANLRRPAKMFEELYHQLRSHFYGSLPDSRSSALGLERLFIIDSTLVKLFSSIMQSPGTYCSNGRKKGGVKAHVILNAQQDTPCFVCIEEGKSADSPFLKQVHLPPGSIVVMDKGYRNFEQFVRFTNSQVSWVTRLHERSHYKQIGENTLTQQDIDNGVQSDLIIELGSPDLTYRTPIQKVRLIHYFDPIGNRTFKFITNNFQLDPKEVADIYRKRWQIEIFFKRLKQNFQLHSFLGDNENAIRIQLWCAFIADMLIKVIQTRVSKVKRWSMANLTSFIRIHLGTYINIFHFLKNPEKALLNYKNPNQEQPALFPP